jgi:hypothetical protein
VDHSHRPLYSHGGVNRDHFQQRRGCHAITIGYRNRRHRRLECPAIYLYRHHRRFTVVRHSNRIPNQSYGHGPWRLPSERLFSLRITAGDPHGNLRANADPYRGAIETIVELDRFPGLSPAIELSPEQHPQRHLTEVVLSRKSPLLSTTVRAARFRQRYDAAVVAIHRAGERLTGKVGDTTLEAGDTLLLQTGTDFLQTHQYNPDFYMVSSVQGSEPRQNNKAKTASLLLIALLLWLVTASIFSPTSANSSLLGLTSPAVAALTIAVLMVLTRCLKMSDARASINLQMLITIGAALGLGNALKESGAATEIANSIFTLAGNHPWTILVALYILTVVLTETISNNAVAAMLLPLAIEIAATGDWNARPFIFTITIAASLSFVTPIGYQTNLMVMGPGGYRANDYFRCGLPLAILMGICALTLIPIVAQF